MNQNQLLGFILMMMGLGLAAPLTHAGENAPRGELLLDFSTPPTYSFLSWEGKPKPADGALLVQTPDDRGGCGYMLKARRSRRLPQRQRRHHARVCLQPGGSRCRGHRHHHRQ